MEKLIRGILFEQQQEPSQIRIPAGLKLIFNSIFFSMGRHTDLDYTPPPSTHIHCTTTHPPHPFLRLHLHIIMLLLQRRLCWPPPAAVLLPLPSHPFIQRALSSPWPKWEAMGRTRVCWLISIKHGSRSAYLGLPLLPGWWFSINDNKQMAYQVANVRTSLLFTRYISSVFCLWRGLCVLQWGR